MDEWQEATGKKALLIQLLKKWSGQNTFLKKKKKRIKDRSFDILKTDLRHPAIHRPRKMIKAERATCLLEWVL